MLVPDVRRYMTREPYSIESTGSLSDARVVMDRHLVRHLPVIDGGRLVGIVTRRDIDALEHVPGIDLDHVEIARVMSAPHYVWSETPIDEIAGLMARRKWDCVVVRGGSGIVGIFTENDALMALSDLVRVGTPARDLVA